MTEPSDAATQEAEPILDRLRRAESAAQKKAFNEAIGICKDVLESAPDCALAYAIQGTIESYRGNPAAGVPILEKAIRLDSNQFMWHANVSGAYRLLHRLNDALCSAQEAVRLAPNVVTNVITLGKVLTDFGRLDEAIGYFLDGLSGDPENAEAHLAIGQILLLQGKFRAGWIEYSWRNELDQAKGTLPKMGTPIWNGMAMPRHSILLIGDQGFGDTIQFCRYIPLVIQMCDKVFVGCSPELVPLLSSIPGIASIHIKWDEIPPHSSHALLSSLPGILNTDMDTIPSAVPYLKACSEQIDIWREKLGPLRGPRKLLIGIVWAGRPSHPNNLRRSMNLELLVPLSTVDGVQLISLQTPIPEGDQECFRSLGLADWSAEMTNFGETAAIIAHVDLVISIDSAVAHLAGATACPTWVLVPNPPEWRWFDNRDDSPWYPTMRLFRQREPGNWMDVVDRVTMALCSFVQERSEQKRCLKAPISLQPLL